MLSPLIVPVILNALGILFLFARIGLINTLFGLVAAHVMHAIPFVFIAAATGLESFDLSHERLARCLGATRTQAFITVVLPQFRFFVGAVSFLAFMSSLDEAVIAFFITGGDLATLPKKMFSALRTSIDPTIAAVSTLLVVISLVVFAANEVLK